MAERILVISNTIDAGGAETFVMRVFRCLQQEVVFDFLINKKDSNFYRKEICNLGGKIYCGTPKSKNPLKSFYGVYRTVKDGKYKKILCISVHPIGWLDLLAARLAGASIRLTRSTVAQSGGELSRAFAAFCRPLMRKLSTVMLAPSKEAGAWLFGWNAVYKGEVQILKNGIQTSFYAFDEQKRKRARALLGLSEDAFVVGHIGRFSRQKNHEKVVNVFWEVKKRNRKAKLMLIGDGELRKEIEDKVNQLGLKDAVLFFGIRNDVPDLLMAMDCFVFPSFYEGMPNAVIEAQATGLPCVVSNEISVDVKIIDALEFLDINYGNDRWADSILASHNFARDKAAEMIVNHGYAIEDTANHIIQLLEN